MAVSLAGSTSSDPKCSDCIFYMKDNLIRPGQVFLVTIIASLDGFAIA